MEGERLIRWLVVALIVLALSTAGVKVVEKVFSNPVTLTL